MNIEAHKKLLQSARNKRQEQLAEKKVLDQEMKRFKKKLKEHGFSSIKELKASIEADKERESELSAKAEKHATKIREALDV